MSREDYWNTQYYQYWRRRTAEANSGAKQSELVKGDRTTVGDIVVEQQLAILEIGDDDKVLDLGCGYGRLFPILSRKTSEIFGTDISASMISEARKAYGNVICDLRVEEAEKSSYPDAFFDRIVCWGVFDATNQVAAISEIIRLLRCGGVVLLTGKNTRYEVSDSEALIAEENARLKGHPNCFTDYRCLREQLLAHGVKIREEKFFLRRGDFSANRFTLDRPERFYEYLLVFEKTDCDDRTAFAPFSSICSVTWTDIRGQVDHRDGGISSESL
jgi:SAM-dependent methyltransferase